MVSKCLSCIMLLAMFATIVFAQASAPPSAPPTSAQTDATPAQRVEPATKGGALYFSKEQVDQIFANAGSFVKASNYTISAGKRTEPGQAEIHGKDTDIFYVLDGSVKIVTGGKLVEEKMTGPDELRGTGIDGGAETELKKGELIVIPNGTPHWMKEVQGTFQYLVVKVR